MRYLALLVLAAACQRTTPAPDAAPVAVSAAAASSAPASQRPATASRVCQLLEADPVLHAKCTLGKANDIAAFHTTSGLKGSITIWATDELFATAIRKPDDAGAAVFYAADARVDMHIYGTPTQAERRALDKIVEAL